MVYAKYYINHAVICLYYYLQKVCNLYMSGISNKAENTTALLAKQITETSHVVKYKD